MFQSVVKLYDQNTGGGKKLLLLDHTSIISLPGVINCTLSGNILVQPDAQIFEIQFTRNTLGFNENYQDVSGSLNGRTSVVTGIVPKDRPEIVCQFEKMNKKRFVAIFTDNNGLLKVIGTKQEPAIFRFTRDNKSRPDNRNEYILTLSAINRNVVPFLGENNTFESQTAFLVYQLRTVINDQLRRNFVPMNSPLR